MLVAAFLLAWLSMAIAPAAYEWNAFFGGALCTAGALIAVTLAFAAGLGAH